MQVQDGLRSACEAAEQPPSVTLLSCHVEQLRLIASLSAVHMPLQRLKQSWQATLLYIKYDLRDIINPRSLPNPPEWREQAGPPLTFRRLWQVQSNPVASSFAPLDGQLARSEQYLSICRHSEQQTRRMQTVGVHHKSHRKERPRHRPQHLLKVQWRKILVCCLAGVNPPLHHMSAVRSRASLHTLDGDDSDDSPIENQHAHARSCNSQRGCWHCATLPTTDVLSASRALPRLPAGVHQRLSGRPARYTQQQQQRCCRCKHAPRCKEQRGKSCSRDLHCY